MEGDPSALFFDEEFRLDRQIEPVPASVENVEIDIFRGLVAQVLEQRGALGDARCAAEHPDFRGVRFRRRRGRNADAINQFRNDNAVPVGIILHVFRQGLRPAFDQCDALLVRRFSACRLLGNDPVRGNLKMRHIAHTQGLLASGHGIGTGGIDRLLNDFFRIFLVIGGHETVVRPVGLNHAFE